MFFYRSSKELITFIILPQKCKKNLPIENEETDNSTPLFDCRKPLDPRAKRFMIKCHCKKKFISHGMEFAVLEIHGQSFMLHQIRKMVALTISYVRNIIPEETIQQAFAQDRIDVPIAPSLGLVLHYVKLIIQPILHNQPYTFDQFPFHPFRYIMDTTTRDMETMEFTKN